MGIDAAISMQGCVAVISNLPATNLFIKTLAFRDAPHDSDENKRGYYEARLATDYSLERRRRGRGLLVLYLCIAQRKSVKRSHEYIFVGAVYITCGRGDTPIQQQIIRPRDKIIHFPTSLLLNQPACDFSTSCVVERKAGMPIKRKRKKIDEASEGGNL